MMMRTGSLRASVLIMSQLASVLQSAAEAAAPLSGENGLLAQRIAATLREFETGDAALTDDELDPHDDWAPAPSRGGVRSAAGRADAAPFDLRAPALVSGVSDRGQLRARGPQAPMMAPPYYRSDGAPRGHSRAPLGCAF
ncbi:hypothetical protein T492DRAFT_833259 [Pavlovales sp. CCMP2436]|nr:hypothetical protein T492DRAFT_833259 [Pavlovales sp. CCMP2436]